MAFPTTLDNLTDGQTIESAHINNLEAKVGADGSAVTSSLDYLLKNPASLDPGHIHTTLSLTKAKAHNNNAQSIPSGTPTIVQINTIDFDPSGIVDTTHYKITPPKPGYYLVIGRVSISCSGSVEIYISKNGSISFVLDYDNNVTGITVRGGATLIYFNGTTDYVQLTVYQTSGSSQPLLNDNDCDCLQVLGPF